MNTWPTQPLHQLQVIILLIFICVELFMMYLAFRWVIRSWSEDQKPDTYRQRKKRPHYRKEVSGR